MKRLSFIFPVIFLALIVLVAAALPAARLLTPASAASDPQDVVQRSWELAKQSGSYSFITQVDQFTVPLPIPTNVGKQSQQQTARLEGTTDLVNRKMEFTLNAEGGSPLDAQSGTQIKVDGDKAYSRQGQQAWQEIPDFTTSLAPQSDFMAFLAGAKNIRLASPSEEAGLAHYAFDVNGPSFAAYMEKQVIQQLSSQGKLPPGAEIDLTKQLASLSGTGEIWIGADGLPVRQVLHVQFPPTSQDQVQADVRVTFQDFGPLPAESAASLSPLERLQNAMQSRAFQDAWLTGGFLGLLGIALVMGLRHKPVYAAIIIGLIVAMVFGPLLQSVKAANFSAEQHAQVQAQEQRQKEAELAQSFNAQPATNFNPNVSPLVQAEAAPSPAGASVFSPAPISLPSDQEEPQAVTASTTDSDFDGLTDDQELLLGTDPNYNDTDADSVPDKDEVTGFSMGGKTWYGDPLNKDSNGDGIGDDREWNKDTNQDGTPDMWSSDNDGDGVPDQPDLSPFQLSPRSYDGDRPFSFSFDYLTPGTLTYVEFQLRPTNVAHLRYAFNVLDWPNNDVKGQIMDADGKTFKDVYPDSDSPQDSYGDVKLVPMLEIAIDGEPTNLPDETILEGYGVNVRNINSDGTQKAVYVPLQVVKDAGDNWVAFYAKMPYLPSDTWGKPQVVRMVWAVEALVDICGAESGGGEEEEGGEAGECTQFETYNDLQIIQTYYDEFTLTGLNVREQHGTRWAIAYKDPAAITNPDLAGSINRLDPLEDLVFVLDHTFLAGRVNENGERDFTISEIRRRFDHTVNGSVPVMPDRFGIDDNILLVNEYDYEHIDQAYQQITTTETKKILDIYTPYWSATEPITPTILFAHEESYRPLNLDSMGAYSNITISEDGYQYSLSMPTSVVAGSSLAPIEVFTATGLSWAPFIYQDGEWAGAPLDEYLEGMRAIYPPETIDPDPAIGEGGLIFLQEYYANIYQGYFHVVKIGEEEFPSEIAETDELMAQYLESWEMVWEPIKIGLQSIFEVGLPYRLVDAVLRIKTYFSNLYNNFTGNFDKLIHFKSGFNYERLHITGLIIGTAFALAWIFAHLPAIHEYLDETTWGKLIIVGISAAFLAIEVYKFISAFGEISQFAAGANGAKSTEFGIIGMIVVTTLLILANLGFLLYMLFSGEKLAGVQVAMMVANFFAQIVVILLFTFISMIPVIGPLLVALYNFINTILSEFLGVNFTEMLTEQITEIFYDVDTMVDLAPTAGDSVYGFLNDRGISVGNGVNVSFPVNVVASQLGPETDWEQRISNDVDTDLKGTRASITVDGNASEIDGNSDWYNKEYYADYRGYDTSGSYVEWPLYRVYGNLTGQLDTIDFTEAGVNVEFNYESVFGYKIHLWRCILLIFCKDKTMDGSVDNEPAPLIFDVLPGDLDTFMAWNWSPAPHQLPAPHDWDNDGLLSYLYQGNDPDDYHWDTDGDTLSDSWEMELAAMPVEDGGYAFNPRRADTDKDGVRDDVEARNGTDPAQADTDGDGRSDLDEINGYNFYYTSTLYTLVRSSPVVQDTDLDGMDDKVEYMLHQMNPSLNPYNPNAKNDLPLSLQLQAGYSGFLSLDATFPLSTTLYNSTGTPIKGTVTTTLPAGVGASQPWQQPFEVLGEKSLVQTNSIYVKPTVTESQLVFESTACGTLETPLVYLPFNEAAGSRIFHNQAASGWYDVACTGLSSSDCPAVVPGRIGNAINFSYPTQRVLINQSSSDLNFSGTQPFTISVWVKPVKTNRTDNQYILSKTTIAGANNGYNLYLMPDGSGNYRIGFNNELYSYWFAPTLYAGNWYNIIAMSDGGKPKLYVDGVVASGYPRSGVYPAPSADPVALGGIVQGIAGTPVQTFVGSMDELYIFDRLLSAGEISSLSTPPAASSQLETQPASTSSCQLTASQAITVTVDSDNPTASFLSPVTGTYIGSSFQVVGGEAQDPTSFIRSVEVSVDGGAFQPANGKESWAYTWDTRSLSQGAHTLTVRAIDAVGHTGISNSVYVKIDHDAPSVTLQPEVWPLPLRPMDIQTWVQHFEGNVVDTGSGVASVEVLVDGGPDLPYGGWQTASLGAGNTWSIDYQFPVSVVDLDPVPNPTGQYTLSTRATDNTGNTITLADPTPVVFDNNPPTISLTSLSPTETITSQLTVSGTITNTEGGGPYGLQVALVPVEQREVTLDAALVMHLNDRSTVNGQIFMDASGFNQTGYSNGSQVPLVYEPGKVDEAVKFDGVDDTIQWQEPLHTPFSTTLTAAMWVKVKETPVENTTLMSLGQAARFYWKTKGGLTFSITDGNGITSEALSNMALTDAQWHHVVGIWTGMAIYIYIDGVQVGVGKPVGMGPLNTSTSLLTLGNSAQGGNPFGGWIDEVYLFPRAFTNQEATNLYNLGNMTWNWASLADNLAPNTTWSYTLPAGPEGLYELELRGIDYLGNRNDNPASWKGWQGEIDMPGPRVTLQTVNQGLTTQVKCSATDFNLSRTGYQCPCTTLPEDMVTYDQVDNWYKEVIVDRTRLYKIMSTCDVSSTLAPFSMQACDKYGACSSTTSGAPAQEAATDAVDSSESPPALEEPAPASLSVLPTSALVDPVDHSVLTSLDPVNLTVQAEAASGLKEITLALDGNLLKSFTFHDATVTGYTDSLRWNPAHDLADGPHDFQVSASDWAGQAQETPITSTIFIDTQPPEIDINPTVYTSADNIANWGVNLTGPVSDLAGVSDVQLSQAGSGEWYRASVVGDQWSYPRRPLTLPDGQTFDVDLQATDLGGHTTLVTRSIFADLVPPSPVTITLSYVNSQGVLTPVTSGQTIYDVPNPDIQISWTPATDGSGLRRYYAGLSQQDPPDLASLTAVDPNEALQISQTAAEAQAYTAYVVSEDNYGNLSWNQFGPVYTDTPFTPDLIDLPPDGSIYRGWMDSGESQIGMNQILQDTLPLGLSLNTAQKFYLSWDAMALRIALMGANWDSDGDLFIYLKTGSGAATDQAYNPYPATAGDTLALPFAADKMIWVTGKQSAQLWRWNGSAWTDMLPGGLPPTSFRFSAHYPASITDLYLPFNYLGIADPTTTPLDLIAFGSQKDALRLWAVFPILNPHDSPQLNKLLYRLPDQHHLVLVNAFHWDNLALGQSPNLSRFLDVDVRALLRAEPMGRIIDNRTNSLYMMLLPYLFAAQAAPPIGEGQVIQYRLDYLNASGAANPADHLLLEVTSTGPLELPGGTLITKPDGTMGYRQVLDLGPMQLGDLGTAEFTGVVNFGPALAQYHLCLQDHPGDPAACQDLRDQISTARIDAELKTSASEDVVISRYTAEHTLVVDPPVDLAVLEAEGSTQALQTLAPSAVSSGLAPSIVEQALAQPPIFVRSGVNILKGTAVDPSGVTSVKVEVLDPDGNTTSTSCQVDAPKSGKWSCAVNLPGAPDEARYFAHVRATNTYGYTSGWSNWRVLAIDMLPPTVSLDAASQSALTSTVIGPITLMISGQIQDNAQVKNLDICASRTDQPENKRCKRVELSSNNGLTGTWSVALPMPLGVEYTSVDLSLYGRDAAGNRSSQPLKTTFWLDTAPPAVTVTRVVPDIKLVDYSKNPVPILAGTASDGSGKIDIVVHMTSPETGTQRTVVTVEGNQWSYIPRISAPGVYTLALQASDIAGNLTSLGSWTLLVDQNAKHYWFPFIMR